MEAPPLQPSILTTSSSSEVRGAMDHVESGLGRIENYGLNMLNPNLEHLLIGLGWVGESKCN